MSVYETNKWGQEVIRKVLQYANYEWYATEKNIKHGTDNNGVDVDTPDITWRGLGSTLEEFENGIKSGKYAGNVPEDKSRKISNDCVGVDCSGLLTVCWNLPQKISTRVIPNYANVVESIDEIQQGDVFAKIGSYVMFFKEFADDDKKVVVIIDATRGTGKVSVRQENIDELFGKGYKIYRKK